MRTALTISVTVAALFALGCSGGSTEQPTTNASSATTGGTASSGDASTFQAKRPAQRYEDPRQAVNDFLVAVRTGDDAAATSLLTTAAQKEAWSNGMAITSDGFPDADFTISEVEQLEGKQEAHVMSTWSDKTPYGEQKSFQCVWLLRQESHGWCIYGMATKFLDNIQPVVLNFENQAEMAKRQQWAEQQIRKQRELELHQQQAIAQEQESESTGPAVRQAAVPATSTFK